MSSAVRIPPEIFKAYDIRGVVADSLTPAVAQLIGRAIGSEARARGAGTVALARDGRLSGPALQTAVAEGLLASGCDVIDVGRCPTPVLYFAAHHLGTGSGVMVTGSHNPPDYNGLKIMLAGETLSGDAIQLLRERIVSGDLSEGRGRYSRTEVVQSYLDRIAGDVRLARRLRVAIDCGNGVAGDTAPALFRRLGCEVLELYCEVDGRFPHHHPDPSQPKNLADLIATVKRERVDVGLAFDGDGDRLGVVSPSGAIVWPDRQMILFARDVLARNPGAPVIYDVKCSRTLGVEIEKAGGKPLMWKTGHSFIKKHLKETGAPLAGEMSGHIFFKERWYGFDDGVYAGARLLELLARDTRPAEAVFAALPDTVNTPELQLKLKEGEHFALIAALARAARFDGARLTTLDGVRADFPDGFGLVRASNTTPSLILRFEGDNAAALARIQADFRALIHNVRPDLALPF